MARRTQIGLDIGSSSVRAAELALRPQGPQLLRFGQVALPEGALRDGEVIDAVAVTAALVQLWQAVKFSHKRVTVGLANPGVVVRQVEVPYLDSEELHRALPLLVGDRVPIDADEAVMDFAALEEIRGSDGSRSLSGLLVAAVEGMIVKTVDAVIAAGLHPVGVDLSSFAALRSLTTMPGLGLGSHAEAVVDVGADLTQIIVHENGIPRFVRILLIGGAAISDELIATLGVDLPAAESLKRELGMADASSLSGPEASAARLINSSAATLIEEIRGSMDYFAATSPCGPVTRLVLTGGGSRLSGFGQQLADRLRLPVDVGSAFASLTIGSTGLTPDQLDFLDPIAAVPVGLALGRPR